MKNATSPGSKLKSCKQLMNFSSCRAQLANFVSKRHSKLQLRPRRQIESYQIPNMIQISKSARHLVLSDYCLLFPCFRLWRVRITTATQEDIIPTTTRSKQAKAIFVGSLLGNKIYNNHKKTERTNETKIKYKKRKDKEHDEAHLLLPAETHQFVTSADRHPCPATQDRDSGACVSDD